jgi:hypothetical protein
MVVFQKLSYANKREDVMFNRFRRLVLIGLVGISIVVMFRSEAKAQYNYLGGGWIVNTYNHAMTFGGVKGVDFKNFTILFESGTVWYDNALSCCVGKNCKNEPLSPGIGHFTLGGSVTPQLDALCKRQGKCTGTVVYPSSVADLQNNANLLADCRDLVGVPDASPQQCFNLLFFGTAEGGHCKNANDTVVRVITKGVCTTAIPKTCTDPTDLSTCTDQNDPVGVRYTFPSFDQPAGAQFDQVLDNTCIACVAGTGPCEPPS